MSPEVTGGRLARVGRQRYRMYEAEDAGSRQTRAIHRETKEPADGERGEDRPDGEPDVVP
jgi:hypothetical protein